MKQTQFKNLLRNAVIAALPLTSQIGCATTETTTEPVKSNDPCRTGETTRKSGQEQFSGGVQRLPQPVTADQCIALCKQEFGKRRIGEVFNDLVKLERIEASDCKTENHPYRSSGFGRGRIEEPSTHFSCKVNYTALHSPYTCPRPVPGRTPHGMHLETGKADTYSSTNTLGQYLADMAAMETAAITAFEYLGRELEAYNAPAELVARAREAVVEETRHAQMAGILSAAYDTDMPEVRVDDFCLRSLYEIALENAVEGCVNETFAAACGVWQSENAQLDVFRTVIAHITDEEIGHAALSWDIHNWIMSQLSHSEQEQIRLAQAEAVDKLVEDFKQEGNPELQRAFGLPSRDDARRLFNQLQNSVWKAVTATGFRFAGQNALA